MSKLSISKNGEAIAVAQIWNMGAESLDPESYCELEHILKILCETRNIDNECIAVEQIVLSGKKTHASDCATSDAPAYVPAPCNCDYKEAQ